jgi:signal transduction histidine kinase
MLTPSTHDTVSQGHNGSEEIAFILDNTGIVTDITPTTLTFCQLTRGNVIGKHFREFIHPDDHTLLSTKIMRCFRQVEPSFEVQLQQRDRKWVKAKIKLSALAQNRNVLVTVDLQPMDTTKTALAKTNRATLYARLSRALMVTNGPPSSIQPALKVVAQTFSASDCYLVETRGPNVWIPVSRWVAHSMNGAKGKQHDWSRFTDLHQKLCDGYPFLTTFLVRDIGLKDKEQHKKPPLICTVLLPIRSTNELVGFLGLDRNGEIGNWKNQEIDILILIAQQLLISIMNVRLTREIKRVRGKESLATIANDLGHLFNNLLNGLLGHTYELRSMINDNDGGLKHLDRIERAGLYAAELTKELVGYALGSTGKRREINLNNLIDEVLPIIENLTNANIRVELIKDPHLPDITANFDQIRLMVRTLCHNAVEALPKGGIITIQTRASHFEKDTYVGTTRIPAGSYVVLTVHDTGTGMDNTTMERIFDPFFSTKQRNRGLGLASARGIVIALGGVITVSSKPSEGSTFTIFLPRC